MRPVRKDPPYSSSRFNSPGYRTKVHKRAMNPLRGKKWDDEFWNMKTERIAGTYSQRGENAPTYSGAWVAFDKEDQKEANRLFRRYYKMDDRADRVKSRFRRRRAREKRDLAKRKFDRRHLGARGHDHMIDFGADLLKNDPRFKDLQQPAPRF